MSEHLTQAAEAWSVSIDSAGVLRLERGYMRPEDDPRVAAPAEEDQAGSDTGAGDGADADTMPGSDEEPSAAADPGVEEPDEEDGVRPISDRLMTELTAHRTLALRDAVANDPDVAFLSAVHVLCLKLFYP